MGKYLARLKNPGTVTAITGGVIIILINCGIQIDSEAVNNIINAVCGICIILGIMNNPETSGLDLPGKGSEGK